MATETAQTSVNGHYNTQAQPYVASDAYGSVQAPQSATVSAASGTQSTTAPSASSGDSNTDISKDEVGWYFVEQYYTTLSRSPEKLHVCIESTKESPIVAYTLPSCSTPSDHSSCPASRPKRCLCLSDKR